MTFESLAPKDWTLRGAVVASLCLANDSGPVAKYVGRHRCRAVMKNRWLCRGRSRAKYMAWRDGALSVFTNGYLVMIDRLQMHRGYTL